MGDIDHRINQLELKLEDCLREKLYLVQVVTSKTGHMISLDSSSLMKDI